MSGELGPAESLLKSLRDRYGEDRDGYIDALEVVVRTLELMLSIKDKEVLKDSP